MKIINVYLPYFIYLILCIFAFLFRGFIAYSDAGSTWFGTGYNALSNLYIWSNTNGLGNINPSGIGFFPLISFYKIVSLGFSNPGDLQRWVWFSYFLIWGTLIIYIFSRFLKNNWLGLTSVLIVFFNPTAQYLLWGKQTIGYYITVPYVLGIILYYVYSRFLSLKYLLLISIIWFFSGFVFIQPAYFGSFPIIIFALFIYVLTLHKKSTAKILVQHLVFALQFILLNFMYIFPLINSGNEILNRAIHIYSKEDLMPILHGLSGLNVFYSITNISAGYGKLFSSLPLVNLAILSLFIGILIQSYRLLIRNTIIFRIRLIIFVFLSLFIFFIFLNKGISEPFSNISSLFYNTWFMYIFRDFKDKFAIGYSIVFSFLFILCIKYSRKEIRYIFLIFAIFFYLVFTQNIWLTKNFISQQFIYLNNLPLQRDSTYRILNLPISNFSFFYTNNPTYNSNSPLRNILQNDIITSAWQGNDPGTFAIKEKMDNSKLNLSEFIEYLKHYNIRYILFHKNALFPENTKELYPIDFLKIINSDSKNFTSVKDTQWYSLIEFNSFTPRILSNNTKFRKINPVLYSIYIHRLSKDQELIFLDTFHKGWKLFPVTNVYNNNCTVTSFKLYGSTFECYSANNTLFQWNHIFATHDYIFDSSHNKIYNYANRWSLQYDDLLRNADNNNIVVNSDGTIDISLYLYFTPQNYMYLGECISVVSLIITFLYIYRKKSIKLKIKK